MTTRAFSMAELLEEGGIRANTRITIIRVYARVCQDSPPPGHGPARHGLSSTPTQAVPADVRLPHRTRHLRRHQGPCRSAVGRADAALARELQDLRRAHAARADPGARAGEALLRARQSRAEDAARRQGERDRPG